LLRRALELRRKLLPAGHPEVAGSLLALGSLYREVGRYTEAEALLVEARAALESHPDRGPDHPDTLTAMENLAIVYNRQARFDRAEPVESEVLARRARVFGAESAEVAVALNNLAVIQANRGNIQGAGERFAQARKLYTKLLGPEHWETSNVARNLARMLEMQGRYAEALPLMREAYQAVRQRVDDGGRGAAVLGGQLGVLLARTGERAEGLGLLRKAYRELDAMFPSGHHHVADTAVALARALLAGQATRAEVGEAERMAGRAVEIRSAQLGADHPKLAEARCWLGIVLAAQGRRDEAQPLLGEALPVFARWGMADPADLREARRRLAEVESGSSR
jgi:tetratricopeptide (TPR) repeat protein